MKQKLFNSLEQLGLFPVLVVGGLAAGLIFVINTFLVFFVGEHITNIEGYSTAAIAITFFFSLLGIVAMMIKSKAYHDEALSETNTAGKAGFLDKALNIASKEFSIEERRIVKFLVLCYAGGQGYILSKLTQNSVVDLVYLAWITGMMSDFLLGQLYAMWKKKDNLGKSKSSANTTTEKKVTVEGKDSSLPVPVNVSSVEKKLSRDVVKKTKE